jgi:hypothetical protein
MKILRPEVEACLVNDGGLQDLFDNVIKVLFNITDAEYDFIIESATDDELNIFLSALGGIETGSTFSERRLAIELRNKILLNFKTQKDE